MNAKASIPFINASIIAPIPDLIAEQGGNMDRVFRRADVPVELAAQPDSIMPMVNYLRLLEEAARETGDAQFVISMAERLAIEDLGLFGQLIASATTLRQAINACCNFVQCYSPALRCRLTILGETARLSYELVGIDAFHEGQRLDCEGTLFLYRDIIRMAAGPNWQPSHVLLSSLSSNQVRAFEQRFGAPVRSADGCYALVFPRHLLGLPMTYTTVKGEAEWVALAAQLRDMVPENSFAGSVRAIVKSHLCAGYPEVADIARSASMSLRSFQRRLETDGVAYSDLVAGARDELAKEFLSNQSLRQIEISQALGYSDASNFARAFKRRNGISPSKYRRALPDALDLGRQPLA